MAAPKTPLALSGADHEKKRDPRSGEITETQTTELDSHARLRKRSINPVNLLGLNNIERVDAPDRSHEVGPIKHDPV